MESIFKFRIFLINLFIALNELSGNFFDSCVCHIIFDIFVFLLDSTFLSILDGIDSNFSFLLFLQINIIKILKVL